MQEARQLAQQESGNASGKGSVATPAIALGNVERLLTALHLMYQVHTRGCCRNAGQSWRGLGLRTVTEQGPDAGRRAALRRLCARRQALAAKRC